MCRDDVFIIVDNKVTEMFYEYQEAEGILSGDIYPELALELWNLEERLTDLIILAMEDNEREV